jgi:hypothetical protein
MELSHFQSLFFIVFSGLQDIPRRSKFSVYISQDGDNPEIKEAIEEYKNWTKRLQHIRKAEIAADQAATAYLAQHYRWALNHVFNQRNHTHLIVLEDDLLLSTDALILFEQTAPLLDLDPVQKTPFSSFFPLISLLVDLVRFLLE